MFVAKLVHQVVNNWSLLFSCKSKNTLNYYTPYLFLGFEYMMYNSRQHIFTTMIKSHTNVSWAYTNLISHGLTPTKA